MYKYLMGGCKKDSARLFSVVPSERTRGNWHKLKYQKLQLNTEKTFFTVRVVKDWNRLPREVMESSSLEIFKTQLHNALSNLLYLTLLGGVGGG